MNAEQILIFKTSIEDFIAEVSYRASSLGPRLEENCSKS